LSPLFRYASVRLDEWDTLIQKLSQQLSDKIMSLSLLLVDPRWVLVLVVHSPIQLGLIKLCELKSLDRMVLSVKHLEQAAMNTSSSPTLQVLLKLFFFLIWCLSSRCIFNTNKQAIELSV